MKKVLALVMVVAMLACTFAVNVAAVDNYQPKTIELVVNSDGMTLSLPEGYVVYVGDTLVFPRGEVVFIDDLKVRNSTEIREMAVGILNDIMIEIDGVRVGQSWSDYLPLNADTAKDVNNYWFEDGTNLATAGKFEFFAYSAHDAAWTEQYLIEPEVKLLSIEVVDPKTVDTIVTPPTPGTTTPDPVVSEDPADTEEPIASTEAPADTEEPTASTEAPVESKEPTSSTEDKTGATGAPAEDNGALVWIIVGAVAVVAVVVVIVVVSKKKK